MHLLDNDGGPCGTTIISVFIDWIGPGQGDNGLGLDFSGQKNQKEHQIL